MSEDFAPPDSLADDAIDFFALNVPRPGGQHVGMYIAPIVAVHRATGISVTVSDVERSQFATRNKAQERLMTVLRSLRERALTDAPTINPEAERMVDAMMAKAIAAGGSRKLTMPALTDDERRALEWVRVIFEDKYKPEQEGEPMSESGQRGMSVLDRLLARGVSHDKESP